MSTELKAESNCVADSDVWDDSLLIKAYNNSVKMAREELAKRIAQSTNNRSADQVDNSDKVLNSDDAASPMFKAGDYVRATYEDGVDYEAKIISIDESTGRCHLKYIGYDNEEEMNLSELVVSWGKQARRMQFAKAKQAAPSTDELFLTNSKTTKTHGTNDFVSFGIPPPPPMPPMLSQSHKTEDSEHLSAMLMSWYMSGYYTGVYQGMQLAKQKLKSKK